MLFQKMEEKEIEADVMKNLEKKNHIAISTHLIPPFWLKYNF